MCLCVSKPYKNHCQRSIWIVKVASVLLKSGAAEVVIGEFVPHFSPAASIEGITTIESHVMQAVGIGKC